MTTYLDPSLEEVALQSLFKVQGQESASLFVLLVACAEAELQQGVLDDDGVAFLDEYGPAHDQPRAGLEASANEAAQEFRLCPHLGLHHAQLGERLKRSENLAVRNVARKRSTSHVEFSNEDGRCAECEEIEELVATAHRFVESQLVHTRRLASFEEKRRRSNIVVDTGGKVSRLLRADFVYDELKQIVRGRELGGDQHSEAHQRELLLDDRIKVDADDLQRIEFLTSEALEYVEDHVADRENRSALKQIS